MAFSLLLWMDQVLQLAADCQTTNLLLKLQAPSKVYCASSNNVLHGISCIYAVSHFVHSISCRLPQASYLRSIVASKVREAIGESGNAEEPWIICRWFHGLSMHIYPWIILGFWFGIVAQPQCLRNFESCPSHPHEWFFGFQGISFGFMLFQWRRSVFHSIFILFASIFWNHSSVHKRITSSTFWDSILVSSHS